MIFDGRIYAREIEEQVNISVATMTRKPKIVSILVGDDPASHLYTRLKNEAANRVGVDYEIIKLDASSSKNEIEYIIEKNGADESVMGIMIQLPIPGLNKGELKEILSKIPLSKDVDGLRWEESNIKPATVASVLSILSEAEKMIGAKLWEGKFAVLGASGAVGKPLVYYLREKGVEVSAIEWDTKDSNLLIKDADVVISCVGKPGLVTGQMIKDGIVAIDVGMSKSEVKVVGDMTREVYQKASFAVPVPGGVGPVTIASLFHNLLEMRDKL